MAVNSRYLSINDGGKIQTNYFNEGAKATNSIGIGPGASANIGSSVVIGNNAQSISTPTITGYFGGVSIGIDSRVQLSGFTASQAADNTSKAFNFHARGYSSGSYNVTNEDIKSAYYTPVSIGASSSALADRAIAFGEGAFAKADFSSALGAGTYVAKEMSFGVALGGLSLLDSSRSVLASTETVGYLGNVSNKFTDTEKTDLSKVSRNKLVWQPNANAISIGSKAGTVTNSDGTFTTSDITRRIINLAAGQEDTDAVNVAQLRMLSDTGLQYNANTGGVQTAKLGSTTTVRGDASNLDYTKFDAGKNIMTKISQDITGAIAIEIALAKDLVGISSISNGATKLTFDNTINQINVNNAKIINLANPTNGGDAVNKTYADKLTSEVLAGDNIKSVDKTSAADGHSIYTINATTYNGTDGVDITGDKTAGYTVALNQATKTSLANADTAMQNFKISDGVNESTISNGNTVTFSTSNPNLEVSNTNGVINYSLTNSLSGITSIVGDGSNQLIITANNKNYTFGDTNLIDTSVITGRDLTQAISTIQTQGGLTQLINGANTIVSGGGTSIDPYKVNLAKDISVDSVTTGDSKLTSDGLIISGGPSITKTGIDAGSKQITNLKSGLIDAGGNIIKLADVSGEMLNNAANIGDLQKVNTTVNTINNSITNTIEKVTYIDENGANKEITYTNENGALTQAGQDALTTNTASGKDKVKNTNVIQAINNINKQGTRFFHINSDEKAQGALEKADEYDSSASVHMAVWL